MGRPSPLTRSRPADFSEAEIAWLAGLLEGEGSFMMTSSQAGDAWNQARTYRYRYPAIRVSMTDRDVIARVAQMFGTKVYEMPNYPREGYAEFKQQWKAHVTGEAAMVWMVALRPWLGDRRGAKVDEILTEYAAILPTDVRRREACQRAASQRERGTNGCFVAKV